MKRAFALCLCLSSILLASAAARAQENPYKNCTVDSLNNYSVILSDSSWGLTQVPVLFEGTGEPMDILARVRILCTEPDGTYVGYSNYFTPKPAEPVEIGFIELHPLTPIVQAIRLACDRSELNVGETARLALEGRYPDGSTVDLTSRDTGTTYGVSNPRIAAVDRAGLVTALASGPAIVWARNNSLVSTVFLQVLATGDRDGDGMPDEYEQAMGFNPLDPRDAGEDREPDGLSNLQEYIHHTNPFVADTEGDGLTDGFEVTSTQTNPLSNDSDNDGLSDALEDLDNDTLTNAREFELGTDPRRQDTDSDGYSDGIEIGRSDPLDPDSIPQIPVTFDAPRTFPVGLTTMEAVKGDWNRDGVLDLAVVALGNYLPPDPENNFGMGGSDRGSLKILRGAGAGGLFAPIQTLQAAVGPTSVVAGHFAGGDSILDLAVTSAGDAFWDGSTPSQLHLFRGLADGSFSLERSVDLGIVPRSLVAGDFDEDGLEDVAFADSGLIRLYAGLTYFATQTKTVTVVLLNGFGGVKGIRVLETSDLNPFSLFTVDIDADGHLDFLTNHWNSASIGVYLGDGQGGFTLSLQSVNWPYRGITGFAFLDFNSDGLLDIALSVADPTGTGLFLMAGDGTGGFTLSLTYDISVDPISGWMLAFSILSDDFTNDGHDDLVLAGPYGNAAIFVSDGQGGFEQRFFALTGLLTQSTLSGDFDGDGKKDLIGVNQGGGNVSFLKGDGTGHFPKPSSYPVPGATNPWDIALSDMDRDGHLDVVTFGQDGSAVILHGDGAGNLGNPLRIQLAGMIQGGAVGDLNADGWNDLVLSGPSQAAGGQGVAVILSDGAGGFAAPVFHDGWAISPGAIGLGDFTGDSRLDLAITTVGNEVLIARGDGQGGLDTPTVQGSTGGVGAVGLVVEDFDLDGALDVAVANIGTYGMGEGDGEGTVSVLFGDRSGSFRNGFSPALVSSGYAPLGIEATDFNGDGAKEIVVTYSGASMGGQGLPMVPGKPSGIKVSVNDGLGHFSDAYPGTLGDGHVVSGAAAADFNRDGVFDLVFANPWGADVWAYIGGGTGQFFGPRSFLTYFLPFRVKSGDMNEDGRADVITMNVQSNSVTVLLNNSPVSASSTASSAFAYLAGLFGQIWGVF